jgi:hypothetical protein
MQSPVLKGHLFFVLSQDDRRKSRTKEAVQKEAT